MEKDNVMEKKVFSFVVKNDCGTRERNNVYYCTVKNKGSELINQTRRVTTLAN